MKKSSFIRVVLTTFLASLGLSSGCTDGDAGASKFLVTLQDAVMKLGVGQELRMGAINPDQWTRLYIFAPYTPLSEIEATTNSKASQAIRRVNVSERDDVYLFVFFNEDTLQMVAAVPRNVIELSVPKEAQPLNPDMAVFKKLDSSKSFVWAGRK